MGRKKVESSVQKMSNTSGDIWSEDKKSEKKQR